MEANNLREALRTSNNDTNRLIEDKRELEELIEKLHHNINYHKSQHN